MAGMKATTRFKENLLKKLLAKLFGRKEATKPLEIVPDERELLSIEKIKKMRQEIEVAGATPIKFDETNTEWVKQQALIYGMTESHFVATIVDSVRCADIVARLMAEIFDRYEPKIDKKKLPEAGEL